MCEDFKRKLTEMDDFNEKIIEKKPWAQRLLSSSIALTKKAVLNWCNTVIKIGESELDVDDYVSIFIKQIETLYEDLIMDVDAIQEKSLDKIVKLLQQMQNLCRDLHIEIPTFSYEDLSLSEVRKILVQRVEEFESLAEIRRKELRDLHQKQIKLCVSLGREPKFLPESPLPLPEEIDKLRQRLETLENEVMDREERFFQLRDQIVDIVHELDIPPTLDFEKEILSLSSTQVKITDNDMEELNSYHNRLEKQLKNVKEEILELRSKVDDLWDKLETDIAERDVFRQKYTGNSLETLKALKEEVRRCEDLKKANIRVFINKQREDLVEIWDKCHCTEDERNKFTFYYSECFNEDLFELHERELEKWNSYFVENQELFGLLQEHKNLWNEFLQLELNSEGTNRFKNRGGQLLIEEKLRNKLTKRIPKIEENLLRLSEAYYNRNGRHFLTFGKTVDEYIAKLHEDRDKEFKLKLSAKKQQREQASSVGRSRINLFPPSTSSFTPSLTPRVPKRKIVTTPVTEPVKKLKTIPEKKKGTSGGPKVNVSRTRRMSKKREKRRQRLSFKSSTNSNSNKENADETNSTCYDEFAKDVISKNNNCRSTSFVFKDLNRDNGSVANTPVKLKTMSENLLTPTSFPHLQKTPRMVTRRLHKY